MPPNRLSRHRFSLGIFDPGDAVTFLSERPVYEYRDFSDNRIHVVKIGDTLQSLAARYFAPMPRPAGFWWVIADFQPDRIHDPTLELEEGTQLVIPSVRTLQEEILNERRRRAGL